MIDITSQFQSNAVILVSAPRPDEMKIARRIAEDLAALSAAKNEFFTRYFEVQSASQFRTVLRWLKKETRRHLKPILHIDMHGDKVRGLEIGASGEFISWAESISKLRKINLAAKNDLCVIVSACYGMHIVRPITIDKPTPFWILLAPQETVTLRDIIDGFETFYHRLFETKDLREGFKCIDGKFKEYYAEKVLVESVAKYINKYCKGKGGDLRRERLLTKALEQGLENSRFNKRELRKIIKKGLVPNQELLDRYSRTFLAGKKCLVSMEEILSEMAAKSE